MVPYEYTPLDAERNEIRLVKLSPGIFPDDVEISIFHYEMADRDGISPGSAPHETDSLFSRSAAWSSTYSDRISLEESPVLNAMPSTQSARESEAQDPDSPIPSITSCPLADQLFSSPPDISPVLPSSIQIRQVSSRHGSVLSNGPSRASDSDGQDSVSDYLESRSSGGVDSGDSSKYHSYESSDSFALNYYEALSYVWGPQTDLQTIIVRHPPQQAPPGSGQEGDAIPIEPCTSTIAITENLAIALRHLRDPETVRTLWIDAICINQEALSERSTEVGRMGDIYHNAKCVLIWLGPEADDSNLAMKALALIGEMMLDESFPSFLYPRRQPSINASQSNERHVEHVIAEKMTSADWFAIGKLINRDWFSRLWVYQEAKRADRSTVIVGSCSLPFDRGPFKEALWWLVWAYYYALCPVSEDFEIRHLTQVFNLVSGDSKTLIEIIESTKYTSCLDDRDRVYAILNLLPAKYTARIHPDYNLEVTDVYREFFLTHLRVDSVVKLLGKFPCRDPLKPLWIPDLGNRLRSIYYSLASGQSKHEIRYLEQSGRLLIPAVHAATIDHIGKSVSPDAGISEVITCCKGWEPPDLNTGTYIDNKSMMDAFLTTITGGHTKELVPVSLDMAMALDDLRTAYMNFIRGQEESNSQIVCRLQSILRGRAWFTTSEGYMGLCPLSSKVGDYICVTLGCDCPLVLRPFSGREEFQIRGECYVDGLTSGEALLGPLPGPWRTQISDSAIGKRLHLTDGNVVTQRDPRLPPLPSEWRERFGWNSNWLHDNECNDNGYPMPVWFENTITTEVVESDPRLTSEALKARGVNFQDFIVV